MGHTTSTTHTLTTHATHQRNARTRRQQATTLRIRRRLRSDAMAMPDYSCQSTPPGPGPDASIFPRTYARVQRVCTHTERRIIGEPHTDAAGHLLLLFSFI